MNSRNPLWTAFAVSTMFAVLAAASVLWARHPGADPAPAPGAPTVNPIARAEQERAPSPGCPLWPSAVWGACWRQLAADALGAEESELGSITPAPRLSMNGGKPAPPTAGRETAKALPRTPGAMRQSPRSTRKIEEHPLQSRIDTMEFRPSDAHEGEFGGSPF